MPAQLRFGTAGATGGGFSAQSGSIQPGFLEARLDVRPDYSWQRRSAKTWKDRSGWASRWPTSRFCGGAEPGMGYAVVGQDLAHSGMYEPFSCDGEGTQSRNFLRGLCKDSNGDIVANATVQAFVTATDLYTGQDVSREDGSYGVGVEQSKATAHYLVAYKAGTPDIAGTTVNTLLPTNVDGTP